MNKKIIDKIFSAKTAIIVLVASILCFLLSVFLFMYFGNWSFSKYLDEEKMGHFGSFIGGVIGTFLVLASAIIYYLALKEQRKATEENQDAFNLQIDALNQQITEFAAQRKELEQTRIVYERQTEIYKQQTQTVKIQQFESNFYSYLDVYVRIKSELRTSENKNFIQGICNTLEQDTNMRETSIIECHSVMSNHYCQLYSSIRGDIFRYLTTVFHLINIIDNSNLKEEEKKIYADIFKFQMEECELLILYYHCHSLFGEKFRYLTLKYNILEHLHPLAKLEFKTKYEMLIFNNLYVFTEELSKLIDKNVSLASSLERTEAIDDTNEYLPYSIMLSFNVDIDFMFSIQFKNTETVMGFYETEFYNFIIHFLYDKFFYSKLRVPLIGNEVESTINKTDDETTFAYIIRSNNIK